MTYYIINRKTMKPINVMYAGEWKIQFLKTVCESYGTVEEAEARLNWLAGIPHLRGKVRNLIISTYAKGFMTN